MLVFVLKLNNNKFYIGKTDSPTFKLEEDFDAKYGTEWTRMYEPIALIELISNCEKYDDDKYTRNYMEKYGIRNVRGGMFSDVTLDKAVLNMLFKTCVECNVQKNAVPIKYVGYYKQIGYFQCKFCNKEFTTQKGWYRHESIYCKA